MIKAKIAPFYIAFKETLENGRMQKKNKLEGDRLSAQIIRLLHAVEKGLCLENPRLGFGVKKIQELFGYAERYIALQDQDPFCLYMVRDAIQEYLQFHAEKGFSNSDTLSIREKLDWLKSVLPENDERFGGIQILEKTEMCYDEKQVENLFATRHSVREFSREPVDQEEIKKAVALAQQCPSACNRQCARVYFVDREKYTTEMNTNLQGVGGFADDAYGFLLVTGKKSAYAPGERNQYLVSTSIFAGYLSLTLHAYSIAACVVQRSVSPNAAWERFKQINGIPEDEQIVLMLAIGKYKEQTKVPVSKRFPVESIYRELK